MSTIHDNSQQSATNIQYYSVQIGFTTFTIDERYQNLVHQGDGSFGIVASAYDVISQRAVAIKKIRNPLSDRATIKRILREIKLLEYFSGHENIASLYDIMTDPPNVPEFEDVYLVTNLFESDLQKILKSHQPLTENHYQFLLFQALRGLKCIHSANVVHRDIKPSNLLVNTSCDLAISDFGLGRNIKSNSKDPLTDYVVTRYYRAPEILCECSHYTRAVDVWSLGCIFAEMITRSPFFRGETPLQQLQAILNKIGGPSKDKLDFITNKTALNTIVRYQKEVCQLPHFGNCFPEGASFLLLDLLKKMLQFHPDDRITVDEALRHPFFTHFHVQTLPSPVCPQPFPFNFEKSYVNYDLIFDSSESSTHTNNRPILFNKVSRLDAEYEAYTNNTLNENIHQDNDKCRKSKVTSSTMSNTSSSLSMESETSSSAAAVAASTMEIETTEAEANEQQMIRDAMVTEMMIKEARHQVISHLSKFRRLNPHMNAFLTYGGPKCII